MYQNEWTICHNLFSALKTICHNLIFIVHYLLDITSTDWVISDLWQIVYNSCVYVRVCNITKY